MGLIYPVENRSRQYGIAKIPPIVPVSYLQERKAESANTNATRSETPNDDGGPASRAKPRGKGKIETYPKRIPPKATKRPMQIAGVAEPATSAGFFSAKPILWMLWWGRPPERDELSLLD